MRRSKLLLLALATAATGMLLAAAPTAATERPELDPALEVPDGHRQVLSTSAHGVQIYDCVEGAWKPREPAATLSHDDHPVALHYAGPTWQSVTDGSKVVAKVTAKVPAEQPDRDVASLLLEATSRPSGGELGDVRYVQRLDTGGGVAPSGGCDPARRPSASVPYTATYTFWVPDSTS